DHADAWDLDSKLELAMDALRCPPGDTPVSVLSGGERRRVALCKLLLRQPDLLLLDEPTNHLDAESVHWLEQHLAKYPGTVLAVTHDRYFLDNVAGWILELDRGRAYPYEGNYSTYLEKKAERLQVQGRKDAKLRRRLAEELEWVRSNARARQTKSRARLERYEQMAAEAEKTRKLDFEEIQIPPGPRLGILVVEVEQLVKGYGDGARRHHRTQRGRQDHAVQDHRRPGEAGLRHGADRGDGQAGLRRPGTGGPGPEQDRLGGGLRRPGPPDGRQGGDAVPGVRGGVRVQGPGPAEAGRRVVRWRAQPPQPRVDAEDRRQRAAARRAHQRPGRGDPLQPGERAAGVPRLRGGDLPRPDVP